MLLLGIALAGLGLWFWLRLRRSGRKIPGAALGIAGTLIGTVLVAKGMPVAGALVAAGSGLWLRYGGALVNRPGTQQAPAPTVIPGRAEAADLLGISPDASREEILAAHRKLIARNHPDTGGSAGLAARINAARDLLLKSQER